MDIPADAARARQKRRVFHPPRLRPFFLALVFLVPALASAGMLITGQPPRGETATMALIAALVLFGGGCALMILRVVRGRPAVVMDADGLTVTLGRGRVEHVDWDAITDVHIFRGPSTPVLGISHQAAATYRGDRTTVFWKNANRSYGFPETAIPSESVAKPLHRLEAEIRRRVPL